MIQKIQQGRNFLCGIFLLSFLCLLPLNARAAETPTMAVEEAKFAIDQARKAGAESKAYDDLAAAKSWLSQAEVQYGEAKSLMSKIRTSKAQKTKEEETIYLATMAKLKAMTAEAKARNVDVSKDLKDTQKDLADYQGAIAVLKQKVAEAEKAKEVQAKAEVERKELQEAKQKASALEAQKKREYEESQKKTSEMEALKQKELQEARLKEVQRAAEREKELAEAKVKAEQLAAQRLKEEGERKKQEEKLVAEREKLATLQKKTEALEREKAMLAEASKIPYATVKTGNQEMVLSILAINLFAQNQEISSSGKSVLEKVARFLKAYPNYPVEVRGHTDSVGKSAANQTLSEKRAQRVREYLVAYQNIDPTRVKSVGLGPDQPAATNATEAGRALNRRVEVAVQMAE